MSKAYKVLADIQADLFILRGISQNISAMYTALEKGDNEPEELFPGVYAIHRQLDDLADSFYASINSYFEDKRNYTCTWDDDDKVSSASGHNMTDDEFMDLLKQHPELWEPVKRVLKSPNPAAEAQKIIQESQKETSTLHPAG